MPIITIEKSNKLLHKKSKKILNFHNPEILLLFQEMNDIVQKPGAAGIAAIQLGKLYRIFALHVDKKNPPVFFCNPRIVALSKNTHETTEGCLSIPGFSYATTRHNAITIAWQDIRGDKYDEYGQKYQYTFDGFEAHAIQHELNHLDGILCSDIANKVIDRSQE